MGFIPPLPECFFLPLSFVCSLYALHSVSFPPVLDGVPQRPWGEGLHGSDLSGSIPGEPSKNAEMRPKEAEILLTDVPCNDGQGRTTCSALVPWDHKGFSANSLWCWEERLDLSMMLNLLLVRGSLNKQGGSACLPGILDLEREEEQAGEEGSPGACPAHT